MISKNDIGNIISFCHIDKSYLYIGKIINYEYKNNMLSFVSIKRFGEDITYCFNDYIFNITIYDMKTYINWKRTSKIKINKDVDNYIESFLIGHNSVIKQFY